VLNRKNKKKPNIASRKRKKEKQMKTFDIARIYSLKASFEISFSFIFLE
jgi:hypothetical protein